MSKIRVGVLRGGKGYGYKASLQSGATVLANIPEEKYQAVDILITKDGQWHIDGAPVSLEDVSRKVDIIFNCLHGEYGEDGKVQKEIDSFSIPHTGTKAVESAFAMNKIVTKDFAKKENILTPRFARVDAKENVDEKSKEIFRSFSFPLMVKPVRMGFSFGATVVKSYEELVDALRTACSLSDSVMVEEYIKGREAKCVIIDNFRKQDSYGLPIAEVRLPKEKLFFDTETKENKTADIICPALFSKDEKREIENIAKKIHKLLGLKHYSQSDFIVSPRGIYLLEANTLPDLSEESIFAKALESVGSGLPEFLDHILVIALDRNF